MLLVVKDKDTGLRRAIPAVNVTVIDEGNAAQHHNVVHHTHGHIVVSVDDAGFDDLLDAVEMLLNAPESEVDFKPGDHNQLIDPNAPPREGPSERVVVQGMLADAGVAFATDPETGWPIDPETKTIISEANAPDYIAAHTRRGRNR